MTDVLKLSDEIEFEIWYHLETESFMEGGRKIFRDNFMRFGNVVTLWAVNGHQIKLGKFEDFKKEGKCWIFNVNCKFLSVLWFLPPNIPIFMLATDVWKYSIMSMSILKFVPLFSRFNIKFWILELSCRRIWK